MGGHAGIALAFDASGPFPWRKNREDRTQMEASWSKEFSSSKYGYERREVEVAMRDEVSIHVMVYRSIASAGKQLPLLFKTHGGGWYQGFTTEEIFLICAIMNSFQFVIVSPEFLLVPVYAFPTGFEDCWDTLLWGLRNEEPL